MQFDIVSIGHLLVEIMRKEKNIDFDQASEFMGPYPSGDTPIFINAAARLGMKCGFIGTVGNDGFGKCITDRLVENKVDVSCIRKVEGVSTAVTFIAYFDKDFRKFLYHLHNASAGLLNEDDVKPDYVNSAKWIHITGFSLSGSKSSRDAALKILDYISDDVNVSFDPNIRVEALGVEELREIAAPVMERAKLFLPSAGEAKNFFGTETDEEACRLVASQGKIAVQKMGEKGCRIYHNDTEIDIPPFSAKEIDPTGAGDTFCAAFISSLIEGKSLYDSGLFANAAGALSITKQGPMEGAPTKEEVERFLEESGY